MGNLGRIEITADRLWDFPGGLHLPDNKLEAPIQVLQAPAQVILPLSQHIGQPAKPVVAVGDRVLRGQVIAEASGYVSTPIHASISGTVSAIEPRPVAHPSGLLADCIVIDSDGKDTVAAPLPVPQDWETLSAEQLRDLVRDAGIVGLGGAAFPSFIKLNTGNRHVDTLILNGAECEPYISADMNLMAQRPDDIVRGAGLIMRAIGARQCLIGIEDNTPNAAQALRDAVAAARIDRVRVVEVPTRYPQGGEKQLVQTLTGQEIPSAGLPLDVGVVCHNVATAGAVWRAVTQGEVLTSRIVSVTGTGLNQPGIFEVRFGTPVSDVVAAAGGTTADAATPIMGGPMMGFSLPSEANAWAQVPVVKATNNLLVLNRSDVRPPEPARACIRCGACADACPAQLLPQQLYWHSKAGEYDKAQHYSLFDCIECGVCAQVCPSHIPLVQYYRHAKSEIWAEEREKRAADVARERHEARQARLERMEAEKKAIRDAKREALRAKKAADDAAYKDAATTPGANAPQARKPSPGAGTADDILARAKAKAASMTAGKAEASGAAPSKAADIVAAAKAKAAQKVTRADTPNPAESADSTDASSTATGTSSNPTKKVAGTESKPNAAAIIAAAKAKAAAKSAAQDGSASTGTDAVTRAQDTLEQAADTPPGTPNAAAIIAAAKAKAAARKADAQPSGASTDADANSETGTSAGATSAAAIVAAAKAKAAARQAAASGQDGAADRSDAARSNPVPDRESATRSDESAVDKKTSAADIIAKAKAAAAARKQGDSS